MRCCIYFVCAKERAADAVLKAKLFGGGEKKNQNPVDIADHPDVQFPVHFFFLGCSVSKWHCSYWSASITVRTLHPFCWGFAITWQFVSTLG